MSDFDANADLNASAKRGETVRDFWERAHKDGLRAWTGGSSSNEVWTRLDLFERVKAKAKVLNIGVGEGHDTRDLAKAGCVVDVLDISPTALKGVKDATRKQFLSTEADRLPRDHYDLAISHVVAQHMDDVAFGRQLAQVIASLTRNGVFAIQFPYLVKDPEKRNPPSETSAKAGGFLRSPKLMEQMATKAGGKVIRSWRTDEFGDVAYHAVHITRR